MGTTPALLEAETRERPLRADFAEVVREMVVATITAPLEEAGQGFATRGEVSAGSSLLRSAVALAAGLPEVQDRFTPGEFTLLKELLGRLS
ncbi:hypothetical protein OG218_13520 [Kineococcus sp. NBC_00420]|uniref:hypothetical protein n=1 Tax=unclassified Kineococcus TaxID=2621656 RepID=UPI002E214090